MKSNLVRVDFRNNDKSEKVQDNDGFRFNYQKLFQGEVAIFQTKKSVNFLAYENVYCLRSKILYKEFKNKI